MKIGREEIQEGLERAGVRPGMGIIVHSSLSSFGGVAGGAACVIDALQKALTPSGTLMMPSFNHGEPFKEGGAGYYNPAETPTINGIIPDTFWRLPDVHRSLNPTHAFAAWGKHAQRYTRHHHETLTMGADSPLGMLEADDGYALMLGVDLEANTFQHVVEQTTGAPCLGLRTEAYPIELPDGRKEMARTWGWRGDSCPLIDEKRYHDPFLSQGLHQEVEIGKSRVLFFRLSDCRETITKLLREGMDMFPPCSRCPIRPRQCEAMVSSDWSAEK